MTFEELRKLKSQTMEKWLVGTPSSLSLPPLGPVELLDPLGFWQHGKMRFVPEPSTNSTRQEIHLSHGSLPGT